MREGKEEAGKETELEITCCGIVCRMISITVVVVVVVAAYLRFLPKVAEQQQRGHHDAVDNGRRVGVVADLGDGLLVQTPHLVQQPFHHQQPLLQHHHPQYAVQ